MSSKLHEASVGIYIKSVLHFVLGMSIANYHLDDTVFSSCSSEVQLSVRVSQLS